MIEATSRRDPRSWVDVVLALWACYVAWEAVSYFIGVRGRFHVESTLMILVAGCIVSGLLGGRPHATEPIQGVLSGQSWLALACLAFAFALYAPALGTGLLSDDFVLMAEGRSGRNVLPETARFFRPLGISVLAALGPTPTLLHAALMAFHGLNAFLVFQLARALSASRASAFSATALFLTFPAAVEAVVWGSGVQDVLMTTAGLLFVLSWGPGRGLWVRTAVALVALTAGLCSKETAVVFPFLGAAVWLPARLPKRDAVWLASSTACAAGAFAIWRFAQAGMVQGYAQPLSRWLLKEMAVRTFAALAVPWHRDLGTAGIVLGATTGALLPFVLVLNARVWRTGKPALVRAARLAVWILLSTAPVYGLLFVSAELEGSRYVYLAVAGWAVLLSELLIGAMGFLTKKTPLAVAPVAMFLTVSAIATRLHLGPWVEASQLRDLTLASAVQQMQAVGCKQPIFENLPDSVRGAYVFRNGFTEALESVSPVRNREGGSCRLVWVGSSFELRP